MPQDAPQKPEDYELELKRSELAILEAELTQRELELATVQASLHTFEQRSKAELDPRYEQLANLQQRIAELLPLVKPSSQSTTTTSKEPAPPHKTPKLPRNRKPRPQSPADVKKDAEAAAAKAAADLSAPEKLKRLYRDVAKAIHPDLADDDIERQHRHTLMVRANEAYDAGDETRLSHVLHEWETSPEAIRGHGSIPELIRVIRKVHRAKLRLAVISRELTRLTGTSLYNLKTMSDEAQTFERDLLREMTTRLDQQIDEAKAQVEELEKQLPPDAFKPPEAESPDPAAASEDAAAPAEPSEEAYDQVDVQTFETDPPKAPTPQ
ncbi:MAG TPA: hypothetical protein VF669_12535 [Tepidisphaeraceae bacterium]